MPQPRKSETSIFKLLCVTAIFVYSAYKLEPYSYETLWLDRFCMFIAGLGIWKIFCELPSPIYNWLLRRRAKKASDNHGSAQWADKKAIASYGLHEANGLFLGTSIYDGAPMFHHGEGHMLVYAPTRSGKTRCLVLTNILHFHSAESMLITDIKGEIFEVTNNSSRTKHKNISYRLDPAGLKNIHGKPARYNPLSLISEAWQNGRHSDVMIKADMIALQLLPEPSQGDQNIFFRNGSRLLLVFVMVYLVVKFDEEATLNKVLAFIQDNLAMQDALQIAICSDLLSGDLAGKAKDLLRDFEAKDSHHWVSFCAGAVQVLDIYSKSGYLAESTSTCDFHFRELKEKDCKIYEIVNPTLMNIFAPWLALIHCCALDELMNCQSNKEVILMLDEASNFKVNQLVEKLTILAGYQCRAIVITQSFSAFEKTYSKEDLEILLDQCECQVWLKVQSYRVAELLSKSLGRKTLVNTQHNLGHNYLDLAQENMGEMARPLLRPDEIMQSPHAIIQLRGKAPILADTVGYDAVHPWNKWAKPNPLYGSKAFVSKTRIRLEYPSMSWWRSCFGLIKRKPIVTYYRRMKPRRDLSRLPMALIWLYRSLILLAPIVACWWMLETYGTPHVLWEYTYRGSRVNPIKTSCTYWSIEGYKTRLGDDCPFLEFIKEE
jgi:type IV secretion system protein VirD4